ncbi:MAG: sigma-70 family RNA polymerase sigma factor [Pseudomonadota bacterium]
MRSGAGSVGPGSGFDRGVDGPAERLDLDRFYRAHWRELCRYIAASFGQGPPEPEDVAQLAFARIAAHRDVAAIGNLKAFLWATARNIVLSEKRSQSVRRRRSKEVGEFFFADGGDDLSAERVLLAREQLAVVRAALASMPAKRRRMLVLHRIEGLSFAEIARRTGLSQTAVKKHVARAMVDLDAMLDED